jgi:hypothetical protein
MEENVLQPHIPMAMMKLVDWLYILFGSRTSE